MTAKTSRREAGKEGSRLPQGWKVVRVGDIFKVIGGGTPSTSRQEFWAGKIPWITSADIDNRHHVTPRRHITEDAINASTTNLVPKGSVIVVTRVGLGKVAEAPEALCFSQDSQALVFDAKQINPRFVVLQLSRKIQVFHHICRGTTINGVTKKQLLELEFLLPPFSEQRRIVAEVEKHLTRLEAGMAALKRVQANLKRYRASVLKAACEGPWPTKTLKDCFKVSRGRFGHRPRNEPRFYNGRFPFVQIGDLPRNGGSITKHTQTLNEAGLAISRLFPAGTVLIAIVGATIGNTGILGFDSCAPDSLVALESADSTLCKFAEYYLQSKKFAIRSTSYASGGQPNINLEFLRSYPFPLPRPAEQTRIVAEVERRLSVVEELEVVVSANLQRATRLRQSILQKAFSGELV